MFISLHQCFPGQARTPRTGAGHAGVPVDRGRPRATRRTGSGRGFAAIASVHYGAAIFVMIGHAGRPRRTIVQT